MIRSCALTVALAGLLPLVCGGCVVVNGGGGWWSDSPAVWIEHTEELEIPLDGVDAFTVESHNGRVDVEAEGDQRTARVVVHKKAGGRDEEDAQACLDALVVKSVTRGHTHSLKADWGRLRKSHWQSTVSYDVHLPQSVRLEVRTHNGQIAVRGLRAQCRLTSHNGRIEARDLTSDLTAITHNGRIEVEAIAPNIHLHTHNASIEARLAGVQRLDGKIETHNGSVNVGLGAGASTRVECQSYLGGIRSSVAMNEVVTDRHSLNGTIGDGDGSLRIVTHNGSISITE